MSDAATSDLARLRTKAVHRAEACRVRSSRIGHRRPGDVLHPLALRAHDRLQGLAARSPDREFLRRTFRSCGEERALPGPPAVLDKHFSQLATGASLSLRRSQW